MHQQLERQAEPLHADEDREGQSGRQAPADRRDAKPDGEHQQQHEDHHHRRRGRRELEEAERRRNVGRCHPDNQPERHAGRRQN